MCCEKWLQGVGAFPDPAEQEDPNKYRGAGCPVLMCHFMACQNGYWVTPTHSVMNFPFSVKKTLFSLRAIKIRTGA